MAEGRATGHRVEVVGAVVVGTGVVDGVRVVVIEGRRVGGREIAVTPWTTRVGSIMVVVMVGVVVVGA